MIMVSKIRYLIIGAVLSLVSISVNAGSWTIESAGGFSQVNLYVPTAQSPIGEGKSLLIVLHGCVQHINEFKTANLEAAAEEHGMVIAVPDAMNKAGFSCWDYWGATKSRLSGDYKNLINLAEEYMASSTLDIDSSKVYITGLSSGGTFAMTTWCLAPDIFSGTAAVGSPPVGSSGEFGVGIPVTPEDTAMKCRAYAGDYAEYFVDQKVSIAFGTDDLTVDQANGPHNAKAMAIVLGLGDEATAININGIAEETIWSGAEELSQVSLLKLFNVDHAWPGGEGATGSYIDGTNMNYAMYLGEFFSGKRDEPEQCNIDISGFEVADPFVPEEDGLVTIAGTVEITGSCVLNSINVNLDGENRSVNGPFISEEFAIESGEHAFTLEVDVMEEDGNSYVTTWNMSFTSESPVPVIPSWCHYYPEFYWIWFPSCAAGL